MGNPEYFGDSKIVILGTIEKQEALIIILLKKRRHVISSYQFFWKQFSRRLIKDFCVFKTLQGGGATEDFSEV